MSTLNLYNVQKARFWDELLTKVPFMLLGLGLRLGLGLGLGLRLGLGLGL